MKMYIVDTHYKCLSEGLLMGTLNISFLGEIKKYHYLLFGKNELYGAMACVKVMTWWDQLFKTLLA